MSNNIDHKFLSVDCFNETWSLLDRSNRTEAENRLMREMAHASLFHWLKREDCKDQNISIGLWQISRVYSVLGDGPSAQKYAKECVDMSEAKELSAFYRGYAREALARAALVLGDCESYTENLREARKLVKFINDPEEKKYLEKDLDEMEQ